MAQMDEMYKNRIATFLRAFYASKCVKEDNIPCKIEEGLLLGSVGVAHNKTALKALHVTHILIVARSLDPAYPEDFIYKKIDDSTVPFDEIESGSCRTLKQDKKPDLVLDSVDTNLEEHFHECFNFIEEARRMGGGVLVHCFAGRSRSVTVVAAYLMKKHRMSLSQALDLIRSKRPQIAPNQGFMLQLQHYEKVLGVEQDLGGK